VRSNHPAGVRPSVLHHGWADDIGIHAQRRQHNNTHQSPRPERFSHALRNSLSHPPQAAFSDRPQTSPKRAEHPRKSGPTRGCAFAPRKRPSRRPPISPSPALSRHVARGALDGGLDQIGSVCPKLSRHSAAIPGDGWDDVSSCPPRTFAHSRWQPAPRRASSPSSSTPGPPPNRWPPTTGSHER